MVLVAFYSSNAIADVLVVDTTNTNVNQSYVSVYCPSGYVMVACTGTVRSSDINGNDTTEVVSPRLNSNYNPTSCHNGPFGPGAGQTLRAFCAKVCN